MNFIYQMPLLFVFLAVFMFLEVASSFRNAVYKRLEEKHSDDEMIELIKTFDVPLSYRLFTSPLAEQRSHLDEGMFPEELCRIREAMTYLMIAISAMALFGKKIGLPGIVPVILLAAEAVLLIRFFMVEQKNAREVLTKLNELTRQSQLQRNTDPETGEPFTKEQKKVVRQAYFLRYCAFAALAAISLVKNYLISFSVGGFILLCAALHTLHHLKRRTPALFCAQQISSSRPLTPFRHSQYIEYKAMRCFHRLWIAELIIGMITTAFGIIYAVLDNC